MIKEIDLTKIRPFDWRYLVGFFAVVVVALLVWGLAQGVTGAIRGAIKPATSEPVGSL